MVFIPENELEKALVRAVKEPHSAPNFYRLLLASDLLVLGSVEGREGAAEPFSLAPGCNVKLVTGTKGNSKYLPVFSSLARMQEYVRQESKYLSLNGRALLDLTRGAPVILNPASEYGKELTPDEVRQLLDGIGAPARAIPGQAVYPALLVEVLSGFFATRSEIENAWIIQVAPASQEGQPQAHPLIGIETSSPGSWPSLMQALEAAAQANVPGLMFDVQRVDRFQPSGMAGALLQSEPFYRRRNSILN